MSDEKKTKTPKDTHYANLRRAYRDQKSGGGAPAFRPRQPVGPGEPAPDGLVRLYGIHTVRAALDNPRRKISHMLVTRNAMERLESPTSPPCPSPPKSSIPETSTRSPAARQCTRVWSSRRSR